MGFCASRLICEFALVAVNEITVHQTAVSTAGAFIASGALGPTIARFGPVIVR
jgi:hypothetical protein